MAFYELLLIAFSLAMDAFAVAVCKGLALRKVRFSHVCVTGAYFGFFQAAMPLIGFYVGSLFSEYVEQIDHWVVFALLAFIGINMLREAFSTEEDCKQDACSIAPSKMIPAALATSIDAFAVGIGFSMLEVAILPSVALIGVVTFVLSCAGVCFGAMLGKRFKKIAEILGGAVLILLGIKVLLEHLGVIAL